ncbi:unnamed protein product [Malus baccata var. baccata]
MDVLQGLITYPVEGILKSVGSLAAQEISLFRGFNKELTKLHQSSLEIQEYLGDVAHKPQDRSMAVRNWVKKLKDVAHDADDVLEDINYEVLRRKVEIQNHMKKKVLNFFSPSNPILFRQKMAHKIKNVNASLAVLKSEASFIGLVARSVDRTPPPIMRNRETDSRFGQYDKIIGREEIVLDIIKILMSKNQEKNLSVMAVVGIGGLGKTTLAKSIFNHDDIRTPFVEKIWVCVSDTFEVNSILNRMLESLDSTKAGLTAREALLKELTEKLKDKRYILILDDVWNEEENFWREFMDCLSKLNSGPGSIAIVTTRSDKVASITETMPRWYLKGLSEEDCWSVIRGEALPDDNASPLDSDQERIGRAIAKKCAGVPLAAKVLGSLMRTQQWLSILESKIWELPDGENRIMSILKLSFDNLREPSLKQCFAYCSMFEKDCEIDKDDLVQLWMAQGYLHSSSMEDKGNEYFNILLQNSLFQDARSYKLGIPKYKMHDLVHDLAEKVFKFESLTQDSGRMDDGALQIQHVARISSTTLERFLQGSVGRLRSLFPPPHFEFSNMFERFKDLRTLNLYKAEIEELPISIGKLKRLRYLNISRTKLKELPKSIGKLYNLQTLKIVSCSKLRCTSIQSTPSLRDLVIEECTTLEGDLSLNGCTSLRELRIKDCNGFTSILSGLHSCSSLRTLSIRDCQNLRTLSGHGIQTPVSLEKMEIRNCPNLEAIPSLDNLTSLTELIISRCDGLTSLPTGLAYCTSLTTLWVSDCPNLEVIPSLDNLKSLTDLLIRVCTSLEGDLSLNGCTSLSELKIQNCNRFTSILSGLHSCTSLRSLVIDDCQNLESFQISPSQSLQELKIVGCPKLRCTSIQNLPSLRDLVIERCPTLEGDLSLNGCTSLSELRIKDCNGFTSILSGLHSCTSLRKVFIKDCPNLRTLSGHGLQTPVSLEKMHILNCPNLEAIPSLDNLTSLTELIIWRCHGLISLPSGLAYCTSLTRLQVELCSNLISLADHNVSSLQSLSYLNLSCCWKLQYLPKGLHSLSRLEELWIGAFCQELDSFPDFQVPSKLKKVTLFGYSMSKLKSLPQQIQHSASLTELTIWRFDGLEALPEWLGNLTSLTKLEILFCENLMYLPTVEAMQRLTKLHKLVIYSCRRLEERCAKDSGPEWPKMSHIPDLSFRGLV